MRFSVLFILLFFSNNSFSQDLDILIEENEIKLKKCIGKGYYDADFSKCYYQNSLELDSILNLIYKKSLPLLKKKDQIDFRENQRKWLIHYNSELEFNKRVFTSKNRDEKYEFGTLVDVSIAHQNYQMLKSRVKILSNYYLILTTGL